MEVYAPGQKLFLKGGVECVVLGVLIESRSCISYKVHVGSNLDDKWCRDFEVQSENEYHASKLQIGFISQGESE